MTETVSGDRWARLKEIFHDALEHDANARQAFVARACGDDSALLTDVERLLAAHDEAGAFIERSPATLTGRVIGRYEVGRLLGAGGMGQVYLARDVELGRDVALKVGGSAADEGRLRHEAQQAARLNHPHICTVHEVGTIDGRCFIVMEHVEGESLADLIPAGGLPIDRVHRLGAEVAGALAHAHAHGVVHRDLKAANVVVTPDGRAKVLDFGLARRIPSAGEDRLSKSRLPQTPEGQVAGTPSYLAPEILRGQAGDERSDIWALGILLFEMAAGTRPFAGATGFELSAAILHEPPAELPPHVPSQLREVIQRCLEKDPSARFARANDVCSALEAPENTPFRPTLPTPPTPPTLLRRTRLVRAVAALLALALLVGTGAFITWRSIASESPVAVGASGRPAIAVMVFDNLGGGDEAAWLSKGVQSMLLTGLAQTRGLDIVSTRRLYEAIREAGAPSLETLDRVQASDVARRAGAGAAVVGSIMQSGSTIRIDAQVEDLSSGRVLAATSVSGTDLFTLVDQLAGRIRDSVGFRDLADTRSIAELSTGSLEAYRLYSLGVDALTNYRLEEAQRLLEGAVAQDPAFAEAYVQLAFVSSASGRVRDRREYLQKAAEYGERLSERQRLLMEVELARDQGRYRDAARGLDDLLTLFPDLEIISTLAMQLHLSLVAPLPDQERLLDITSRVVAANPTSTMARNNLGYALLQAGRFAEGIQELETSARLAPREPNPHDSLGEAYLVMGLPDQAIQSYSRALSIDPMFMPSLGGRAWVLAVTGRLDEALQQQGLPGPLHAVILARAGRYREAHRTISEVASAAGEDGDVGRQGGLHLLWALLAIEREDYARALDECAAANRILTALPEERRRFTMGLLELIAGVAEARSTRLAAARSRLDSQRRLSSPAFEGDEWWQRLLEGEIALAAGDLNAASSAFARAEPSRKRFVAGLVEASVLSNDLVFRDGLARVARARGDLRGAIDVYRRLLTFGPEQKWVAVFEPRYVLEIARLLEKTGDAQAARAEYERFLQFRTRADVDLPEVTEARRAMQRLAVPASR